MKKKLLIVAMLIVVIMTAVLLVGCDTNKMNIGFMASADSEIEMVKVNIKDYDGKMLSDLLKAEESLGAVLTDSEYGPYINEIKNLKPQGNQYVAVFTSDESKKNTYEGGKEPIIKNGITYYESGVGISGLPVSKDIHYLFVLLEF